LFVSITARYRLLYTASCVHVSQQQRKMMPCALAAHVGYLGCPSVSVLCCRFSVFV